MLPLHISSARDGGFPRLPPPSDALARNALQGLRQDGPGLLPSVESFFMARVQVATALLLLLVGDLVLPEGAARVHLCCGNTLRHLILSIALDCV